MHMYHMSLCQRLGLVFGSRLRAPDISTLERTDEATREAAVAYIDQQEQMASVFNILSTVPSDDLLPPPAAFTAPEPVISNTSDDEKDDKRVIIMTDKDESAGGQEKETNNNMVFIHQLQYDNSILNNQFSSLEQSLNIANAEADRLRSELSEQRRICEEEHIIQLNKYNIEHQLYIQKSIDDANTIATQLTTIHSLQDENQKLLTETRKSSDNPSPMPEMVNNQLIVPPIVENTTNTNNNEIISVESTSESGRVRALVKQFEEGNTPRK